MAKSPNSQIWIGGIKAALDAGKGNSTKSRGNRESKNNDNRRSFDCFAHRVR
jgi:hypothetical protein